MPNLSWNEIRQRAIRFSREWQGVTDERAEAQTFWNEFFDVFGKKRRLLASFEERVKSLGDKRGFIDLFWKGVLLVEQKSVGRNLKKAKTQALDYFPGLKDTDLPRYILLSDFQTFELYDLEEDEALFLTLADLPRHIEKFGFIIGVQKRTFKDQDPVNIAASELVGKLHDALEEAGYIRGYHADIDPRELGFEVQVFAMVRLHSQAESDLNAFEARGRAWPLVRECHMLNGEIDFILKCVSPDLTSFQRFLTEKLTAAPNVASVKTSLVIRCAKDEPGVPFSVVEERAAALG